MGLPDIEGFNELVDHRECPLCDYQCDSGIALLFHLDDAHDLFRLEYERWAGSARARDKRTCPCGATFYGAFAASLHLAEFHDLGAHFVKGVLSKL